MQINSITYELSKQLNDKNYKTDNLTYLLASSELNLRSVVEVGQDKFDGMWGYDHYS